MNKQKYLFACYSESDYEDVDNIFLDLFKHGIPIKDGKDCSALEIDTVISESEAILLVISPQSMESGTISYQLQLAEQYNKHIIPYFLYSPEEVKIPSSFYMKMDGSASIPAYEYAVESALVQRALSELKPYFPEAFEDKKTIKNAPLFAAFCGIVACFLIFVGYFSVIKPKSQEKMMEHLRNSTVLIYNYMGNDIEEVTTDSFSSGSGFFVNENGMIATNYHVIEDYSYLIIQPTNDSDNCYLAESTCFFRSAPQVCPSTSFANPQEL